MFLVCNVTGLGEVSIALKSHNILTNTFTVLFRAVRRCFVQKGGSDAMSGRGEV